MLKAVFIAALWMLSLPLVSFAQTNSLKSPNVSGNALFLYRNSNFHQGDFDTTPNGLDLREAELAFYSEVDPYSRLNMLISVHPEYEGEDSDGDGQVDRLKQSWVFEPEELFAESNHVPSVTLKIGKFKAAMGKHNLLHTHAFPFVEAPLVNSQLLGEEGLNDVGVSAAGLLPTSWFSEITAQYLRGKGENEEFHSPSPGQGVFVAHWKNLFDLSEALTFEIGASYAEGQNALKGKTSLSGADITLKWRPTEGGRFRSWILAAEYLQRKMEQPPAQDDLGEGWNLWGQYQFGERWAALARSEQLKVENSAGLTNGETFGQSVGLSFAPTEFSSYRLEYGWSHGPANAKGDTDERKVLLQANFTIGAHPSHSY